MGTYMHTLCRNLMAKMNFSQYDITKTHKEALQNTHTHFSLKAKCPQRRGNCKTEMHQADFLNHC